MRLNIGLFLPTFLVSVQKNRIASRLQWAYHLLTEEYPQSLPFITPIDDYHWRLQTLVASYTGVGRFVIGLYDDIKVEGDEDFKAYLHTRIQKLLQHKAL